MDASEIIIIFSNASLIIQVEYVLLLMMSLACWAIIFAKAIQFRKARRDEEMDLDTIRRAKTLDEIVKGLPYSDDTVSSSLIREGVLEHEQLEKVEASPGERARILLENVRQAMHEESFAISRRLSRGLGFLAMSANAAPL
ncbi:MAG: MotA/TolQ/ExbB proton channel family protein, partial [Oceanidesulfovibrio sp.]